MAASVAGATAPTVVAAPFDVNKVRMQATALDSMSVSGIYVLRTLVKNEGIWALSKSVGPKLIASTPTVAFSYTVAQSLTDWFHRIKRCARIF